MPDESSPPTGDLKVTLRLDEVSAIENPELASEAEWWLRLWVNGLERWRSDTELKLGKGETAELGQEIVTHVAPWCQELEVAVRARERDRLNPDDQAAGEVVLTRAQGFSKYTGVKIDAVGPGANLELRFTVEVTPID